MSEKRRALGRGLGALIPNAPTSPTSRPVDVFFPDQRPTATPEIPDGASTGQANGSGVNGSGINGHGHNGHAVNGSGLNGSGVNTHGDDDQASGPQEAPSATRAPSAFHMPLVRRM